MQNKSPDVEEWKNLYAAATKFRDSNCWEWMYDTDMFGIVDPYTGETGYCCIMGNEGEVFGLVIYRGDEGLRIYYDVIEDGFRQDEALYMQDSLMVTFEDRDYIDKKDYAVIKKLGLKFRGRKKWPFFRSYIPGFFPWYLEKNEANFLTLALEQALEIALVCKKDKKAVTPKDSGEILVRVPRKNGNDFIWEDNHQKLYFEEEDLSKYEYFDELRVKRLQSKKNRKGIIWEVDFFHSPAAVNGEERPYFPLIYMMADSSSGMMLDMEMIGEKDDYIPVFQEKFISYAEKVDTVPQVVIVQRKDVYKTLEPITKRLGIIIRLVEELVVIENYKEELDILMNE